jgi:hypothetical protein
MLLPETLWDNVTWLTPPHKRTLGDVEKVPPVPTPLRLLLQVKTPL